MMKTIINGVETAPVAVVKLKNLMTSVEIEELIRSRKN